MRANGAGKEISRHKKMTANAEMSRAGNKRKGGGRLTRGAAGKKAGRDGLRLAMTGRP